jgi:hypothetical protein
MMNSPNNPAPLPNARNCGSKYAVMAMTAALMAEASNKDSNERARGDIATVEVDDIVFGLDFGAGAGVGAGADIGVESTTEILKLR